MISGDNCAVFLLCALGYIFLLGCTPDKTAIRISPALSCATGNTLQLGMSRDIAILPWLLQATGVVSMLHIVRSVISWGVDLATVKLARYFGGAWVCRDVDKWPCVPIPT